jgi:hypothetical protein
MKETGLRLDPGSFRDPAGYVFSLDDQTYRALDAPSFSLVQELEGGGVLSELSGRGYPINTLVIAPTEPLFKALQAQLPREHHFLHHHTVPVISYPYEWSFSMLADARLSDIF